MSRNLAERLDKEIRFEFHTDCLEVYKSADGKPHIRAVASDSLEDRQGDVITETCIGKMAEQVAKGEIPLLPDHRSSFEIGTSRGGETRRNPETNGLELVTDFELDERYTEATVLFNEVSSRKCKRQLSIGGYLNKNNPRSAYMDRVNGKVVMVLDDIILDHIAVTREGKAANPRTNFVDAIVKSIDNAGFAVTETGLVEREPTTADVPEGVQVPEAIKKLDKKYANTWRSVWKDTFVRQMHIGQQSVETAETAAAGVATSVIAKQIGTLLDVNPDEYVVARKDKETYALGTTRSKDGHTHLWVSKMVGEKFIDGMMLTVKGHSHNILVTGECDRDGDHYHTMVRKDRKVAEPSTELSAPVGLLYFGKGVGSEEDVRLWLDANGISPLSITRVADSTYTVEFSLSPFTSDTEKPAEGNAEMTTKAATVANIEKSTVPYKAWPMSDDRRWSWTSVDSDAVLGGDNWERHKSAYTYYDETRGATPLIKGAYSLPHHKLSNGELRTYSGGVVAATAILNGARGGFRRDMSEEGRKSLHAHLAKHYGQMERTPPALRDKWMARLKEDFSHPNPKTLAERDYEDFVFALEQCGLKDAEVPEFLTKAWWMTWDEDATGLAAIPEKEKGIWSEIEKAVVEDKNAMETSLVSQPTPEVATTKDANSGTSDNQPPKLAEAAVAKSDDSNSMKKIEETIAGLATATQKALSDLIGTVTELGTRIGQLETAKAAPEKVVAEVAPAAPAVQAVAAVAEKTVDAPVAPEAVKPQAIPAAVVAAIPPVPAAPAENDVTPVVAETEKTAGQAPTETIVAGVTSPEVKPVQTPSEFLGAFHALLASMGMTDKDFFGPMAQKSLDSMGPSLTVAVEKTVKESISALQSGVQADVEKAVAGKLDAKLLEVAKDFRETIEKLDVRLEKVEQVGGVPKGASGQEGAPETSGKPLGKFSGLFARALRKQ